ncbi:DUF2939 domain-containing protein [Acinetobacter sp. MB5]|uniref:DUF2939 domain-containing protein n=1 Tax=Acinetobacter sp. MB5 TaxID=2069438 RepID=UPI000DCFC4AE|nr:DUF2939 domain-containing protein [Acinetobacter sp. MB5]
MKKLILALGVAMFMCVLAWLASPYWMMYQLKQAYENNQPEKISAYIDYHAVKESLKPQMNARWFGADLNQGERPSWRHLVGEYIGEPITNAILDRVVTPKTMILLLQGKQFSQSLAHSQADASSTVMQANMSHTASDSAPTESSNELQYHAGYQDLNHFVIHVVHLQGADTQFIFTRDGWNWKMTDIDLGLAKVQQAS